MRVLLIEDEEKQLEYLKNILAKYVPKAIVIGVANTVEESVEKLKDLRPEVVLADVQLKDGLSFEIFKTANLPKFKIIFITGYDEFRLKAMEHYAFQFLLKPVFGQDLVESFSALAKIDQKENDFNIKAGIDFISGNEDKILIYSQNKIDFVNVKAIVKCKANGSYTDIFLSDEKKYLASKNLKHFEILLKSRGFVRISRSFLVNRNFIKKIINDKKVILDTNESLEISKTGKLNIKNIFSD